MSFSYRLAVLTHGDAAPLHDTMESFGAHVSPRPVQITIIGDGTQSLHFPIWVLEHCDDHPLITIAAEELDPPLGFCGATRALWDAAGQPGVDYVFWLEHDFIFTRPVNLEHLAYVLDANPHLAQMSLMRQPVNESEIAAGGIMQQQTEAWAFMTTGDGHEWMSQRLFYTTNPSLIPISVLRENEWPHGPECEGKFGIQLREKGYSFGFWGNGEPWVEHVGVRTGTGY